VEIAISSRGSDLSDALEAATRLKIGKLDRFLDGLELATVHYAEEKNPRIADKEICEVTIEGHGHHVRCKVAAPDGFQAVDKAYDKLEHQLHKLKTKLTRRHQGAPKAHKKAGALGAIAVVEAEEIEVEETPVEEGLQIVKSKRFAIHPMLAEEAVERMELLGHGFFFFTNVETSRSAVVYKRDDGQVGLIDEAD